MGIQNIINCNCLLTLFCIILNIVEKWCLDKLVSIHSINKTQISQLYVFSYEIYSSNNFRFFWSKARLSVVTRKVTRTFFMKNTFKKLFFLVWRYEKNSTSFYISCLSWRLGKKDAGQMDNLKSVRLFGTNYQLFYVVSETQFINNIYPPIQLC